MRRPAGATELRIRDGIWTDAEPRWQARLTAEGERLIEIPVALDEVGTVIIEIE